MAEQAPIAKSKPYHIEFDFMRVVAAVAVVIIHCMAILVLGLPVGSKSWFASDLVDAAVRWSVPVFVMLSGALIISPKSFQDTGTFFKRRFSRIIVPLLIWPVMYVVWNEMVKGVAYDIKGAYFAMLAGSPAPGHLYFLFLIANLYLLTPIISLVVANSTRRQLWGYCAAIFAATFVWHAVEMFVLRGGPPVNFLTQGLPYVGYFLLGYLLADFRVPKKYHKYMLLAFAVSVAAIAWLAYIMTRRYGFDKGLYFYNFPTPFVAVSAVVAYLMIAEYGRRLYTGLSSSAKAKAAKLMPAIAATTFGIYLIHIAVIDVVRRLPYFSKVTLTTTLLAIPVVLAMSFVTVFAVQRVPYLRRLIP